MKFTDKEIIDLKRFCQEVINKPRKLSEQYCSREGVFVYCDDWQIIEICKYLFNGHEGYMGDPPPNRLKFNPLWSKENVAQEAKELVLAMQGKMELIIMNLRNRRSREYARSS